MFQLLMPRKSTRPSALRVLINRAAGLVAEFRPATPVPATAPVVVVVEPVVVDVEPAEPFTEADMPALADIEAAAQEFWRAADAARAAERTKRRTRKTLDRLRSGRYAGWEIERVESSRQVADLDAIKRIFRENGLGVVPMKSASPSLKVRRVESEVLASSATDMEFAALAVAMTR